jgi:type VI secretion system protein ImpG
LRKDDAGTEIDLCFTDLDFDPRAPVETPAATDTVIPVLTCLNRELPSKLRQVGGDLAFEPLGNLPADIRCLVPPTPTLRPKVGKGGYWKLISHLSLNHLSLADKDQGRQALQEYLALYDYATPQTSDNRAEVAQLVRDGVAAVGSRRDVAFLTGDPGGYARGLEVAVTLDEEKYVGVGAYLFAAVLERFVALYASVNSFTRLAYRSAQRGEVKRWPPRAGDRPLA